LQRNFIATSGDRLEARKGIPEGFWRNQAMLRIDVLSRTEQAGFDNHATIQQRIRSQLDRFRDRLSALSFDLSDENGPKGGVDRRCRLRAELVDGRVLVTAARHSLLPAAVDLAVRRLARQLRDRSARSVKLRRVRSRDTLLTSPA
jgi:ribosome-associated translation inhibitor RaiA